MEKSYTILFGKNKDNIGNDDSESYLYLTRFHKTWEFDKTSYNGYIYRKKYASDGELQNEVTSFELCRSRTKVNDLYYFSLEEVERIMKKLRKKIHKQNKIRKSGKSPRPSLYAYGKEPFIVKKTKIKQYLKDSVY